MDTDTKRELVSRLYLIPAFGFLISMGTVLLTIDAIKALIKKRLDNPNGR